MIVFRKDSFILYDGRFKNYEFIPAKDKYIRGEIARIKNGFLLEADTNTTGVNFVEINDLQSDSNGFEVHTFLTKNIKLTLNDSITYFLNETSLDTFIETNFLIRKIEITDYPDEPNLLTYYRTFIPDTIGKSIIKLNFIFSSFDPLLRMNLNYKLIKNNKKYFLMDEKDSIIRILKIFDYQKERRKQERRCKFWQKLPFFLRRRIIDPCL